MATLKERLRGAQPLGAANHAAAAAPKSMLESFAGGVAEVGVGAVSPTRQQPKTSFDINLGG